MLGIFKDLSNEHYHNDRSAVSRSGLKKFRECPSRYWNEYLNPERPEKKSTPDMIFGSAFHTFVLEPHLFDQKYFVKTSDFPFVDAKPLKKDLQAQYGKAIGEKLYEEAKETEANQKEHRKRVIAQFEESSAGKELLTIDQMSKLTLMRQKVLDHPEASKLIQNGAIETSFFWEDPHTGVRCKTRPDVLFDNMTVDLKTTKDASERAFTNDVVKYSYHLQAAMNREGVYHTGGNDIKNHVFICVEKEWPYLVAVYALHRSVLDFAHNILKNTLEKFKFSQESGVWESYETKEIYLPKWAENEELH